ncbi:MAG: TIGR00730 family Rossman fold protein [Anaerolineae bacterium]|nr:TIGR00730 family Rossman fold protein [Anaerolineae bacterium]
MQRVGVFCGSSPGKRDVYGDAARALGQALAGRGLGLVYGGGRVGLMGTVADAVLAAGGEVIGVIPTALSAKEIAHPGLTQQHIVPTMHERKALMADLADAFIALPGGYGTLDEFCEILTWAQLGLHRKPCGLLNTDGYFTPFLQFINHAVAEGFVWPIHRDIVLVGDEPGALLDRLDGYVMPQVAKWVKRDEI